MSAEGTTLRLVVLSGTQASREIAGVLADWHAVGLVEDAHVAFVDALNVDGVAPAIPAQTLSGMVSGDTEGEDFIRRSSRSLDLQAVRAVLLHDCDAGATVGSSEAQYFDRFEAIRSAVDRATPRRLGDDGRQMIRLRVLNLFVPVKGGSDFPREARIRINAPAVLLSTEDRAQPDGVAGGVTRDDGYPAHAAAAAATLVGLWRGLPLPELEGILAELGGGGEQLRAFRQMVRLGMASDPIGEVVDQAAGVMRGERDPGMADLGVVWRGPATDRRILSAAFDSVRDYPGDPLIFTEPEPEPFEQILIAGEEKRWSFARRELKETFATAWRRFLLWRERRRHNSLIGPDNRFRELADKVDVPARRVEKARRLAEGVARERPNARAAKLQQFEEEFKREFAQASLDQDAPEIEPGLLLAIQNATFSLVDGGLTAKDSADAVEVVSSRSLVSPHPRRMPTVDAALLDMAALDEQPYSYLDQWALGGWMHQLQYTDEAQTPTDPEMDDVRTV